MIYAAVFVCLLTVLSVGLVACWAAIGTLEPLTPGAAVRGRPAGPFVASHRR